MYDELVKRLRLAKAVLSRNKDLIALLSDAADAIEELARENESLAKSVNEASEILRRRWIPVTERLPREGEFVLVYGDLHPNKHDGGVIAVSKRMDWNYWQGFGRERDITHWMPLPEPPKEET